MRNEDGQYQRKRGQIGPPGWSKYPGRAVRRMRTLLCLRLSGCHRATSPWLFVIPWARDLVVENEGSWHGVRRSFGAELFQGFARVDRNLRIDKLLRPHLPGNANLAEHFVPRRLILERRGDAPSCEEPGKRADLGIANSRGSKGRKVGRGASKMSGVGVAAGAFAPSIDTHV